MATRKLKSDLEKGIDAGLNLAQILVFRDRVRTLKNKADQSREPYSSSSWTSELNEATRNLANYLSCFSESCIDLASAQKEESRINSARLVDPSYIKMAVNAYKEALDILNPEEE